MKHIALAAAAAMVAASATLPVSAGASTTLALESESLSVQANPATGALTVRDKRTGREWQTVAAPATPSFANTPRFTLSGAELVVEADFASLPAAGTVFPAPLAPNAGDALVVPMSEGFRIPFGECDLLKGVELEAWHGSHLSMPFFGVVDANDESGFMVILETPDDAKIKCFADASDAGVGAVAPLWVSECGSPGYTRRARFVFFDAGGYVAMAKRYRAYAAAQGLVKTFAEKAAERPLVERLPGAANIWYFPGSGEPSHAVLAAKLREAGIDRLLWSWNSTPTPSDLAAISAMPNTLAGRYDVVRDVYYPDLLDALGRENPPASEITLNTSAWPNDVMWDSANSSDWRRGWGVTGTNGATYHCAAQCDIPAVARTRRIAGNDLTNNPYSARFIDVAAAKGLEECYNPAHPMTRRVSRAKKTELFEMLGDEFGIVVGSEQGMDAFAPVCDYFEGMMSPSAARMPGRRDGYGRSDRFNDDGTVPAALSADEVARMERYALNERYRIPLFELVYHGCVASHWYWFDYSNGPVYWWWKRDIFNALYGTAPMYVFNYALWHERKAEFVQSWWRTGGIARKTGFSEMVSHRSLTADRSVQETRFADGTVVVADFTARSAAAGVRTNQTFTVEVPEGQSMNIDATFVMALGTDDLVKTGRGTLVSANVMSNYTGAITVREGALVVKTTADLGTADGGTFVEDGGTLVVAMSSGQERFRDEPFTIAGTGDAAYGAAVYQSDRSNDRFKIFKHLTLSGDATIYAGTRLGLDNGALAMNGYTLTVKGANFTLRNITTPAPVGDIVTEAKLVFLNGSGAIGDAANTLTVRRGGSVSIGENNKGLEWRFVVEDGCALDANNIPFAVSNLVGGATVTNVTTFTVSDSWTLSAADIVDGASLVVHGGLVFGDGCAINVTGISALPVPASYTVCRADSISGIPAGGVEIVSGTSVWRFVLANGGTELNLVGSERSSGNIGENEYEVYVPLEQTRTIDAALVAEIGEKNLVKTGRGKLVSSADMASYTGTITIRQGAFEITTTSDLGTAAGGTIVEDGGTLVVNMATKDQTFGSETFTIAGTGDATYGAAIYQSDYHNNDQNKLFKNIVLSDDATIFSGVHLGLVDNSLTMNGHTLTIKGNGGFTFRHTQTPAPVGNLVVEVGACRFRGGTNATGDASKTLTIRNGSTLVLGYSNDNAPPIWWNLVVEEGGKVSAETSSPRTYYGDVEWNSTAADGISGSLAFNGEVTGTGTIKASSGTLTFAKPLGAGVGLNLSGTATATLPTAKAYSYEHKGMKIIRRSTQTSDLTYFSDTRTDVVRDYCAFGPGPQLDASYWSMAGKKSWCSRGYLWNRETTNVTYTIGINCVYKNYVFVDGSQVYYKQRDGESSGSTAISVPAGSCVPIDIVTTSDQLYGPRTEKGDGDKFKINGTVANDPTGWYFTTNAVSGVANPAALPTLSLGNDAILDANNMPLTVSNLVGGATVTNVTTLTVSDSWTLSAAEIEAGASLVVHGALAFGENCRLSVAGVRDLPLGNTYTVCTADAIAGFPADKARTSSSEGSRMWRFTLSGDGKSISLVNIPLASYLELR